MKCPMTKEECWREECIRWDTKKGQCRDIVQAESTEAYLEQWSKATEMYGEMTKYYQLILRFAISQVLRDPEIPEELKEELRKAQTADAAEKILRDGGII